MTIAGCDRVALGVQVVSSSEAHHLWRVWKACSEENVESDVHRPRKGGVRQRISPSKASKGPADRLLVTDRAEVQFAYHPLKPSRLIYIGAAAFGEAKKQPTTLVSASPGYRYLQRRSTNRTIEHGMWRQTDSRPYLVRKISARSKSISYLALRRLLKHGLKSILKCPGY